MTTQPTDFVYVPISAAIYAELIRRSGRDNVAIYIENQVQDFLDSTEGDPDIWSAAYIERHAKDLSDQFAEEYGEPTRGYQWQNVFLPNGTSIRMTYRGDARHAEIRHEKLIYGKESMSPSEFASRVASNTSRNAWRDIYVKFPGDSGWTFADDLRRKKSR
ncbi:hypothetical protein [Thioclava atlantica]|uniref:Uncharacterized protein n=1 Tax=Thioclava atlantica TaxID=1317124 RepID=A0A085U0U1_9RHOB|nr:hypothetical protein [Thioclava atlantica]KFE36588.1 hypothetical protein DW2_00480 [Thioclava atlantica]